MKKLLFLIPAVLLMLGLAQPLASPKSEHPNCTTTKAVLLQGYSNKAIIVANLTATPVYLGGSDVTTANGFAVCTDTALCASSSLSFDGYGLYCVAGSTVAIQVLGGRQ